MSDNSPYDPQAGDWQTLATFFSPTEAHLLRGRLQACGIPAALADDQILQTYSLLAGAIEVRVLVPQRWLQEAHAVHLSWQRGDFALPQDDPQ